MDEGRVAELWRYPVKSLRGEKCASVEFDERGVAGDRTWALVDDDGKIGSHKSTRRFTRMAGLFEMQGLMNGDGTEVVLTGGRRLRVGDSALNDELSVRVGRAVRVEREAETSFQDAGAVHVLTHASLRWLRSRHPAGQADARRFRPNVVLEWPGVDLVESQWAGRILELGEVRLQITEGTERCVMTTLAQDDLPKDPRVLKTIAQGADARFGVYAKVVRAGWVREGDSATLLD